MRGQPLVVAEQDRHTLASWARAAKMEQRLAWRARLLLALARGQRARAVAQAFHTRPSTATPGGMAGCWPRPWAQSVRIRFGGCHARTGI